jgi:hypothetical protein
MDAEEKRVERLPPMAERADVNDRIGHPVTLIPNATGSAADTAGVVMFSVQLSTFTSA